MTHSRRILAFLAVVVVACLGGIRCSGAPTSPPASLAAAHTPLVDLPKAGREPGAEPERPERRYGLAISGGVSLGAYEAGGVWAFVRYLVERPPMEDDRYRPRLSAVSGASAGGINAVLAALSYCSETANARAAADGRLDMTADTVTSNPFRNTWLAVGADELLPLPDRWPNDDLSDAWRDDDGLLTRNAFEAPLEALRRFATADAFRPGCTMPLTVLVTSAVPVDTGPRGLDVPTLRFAIPLVLHTGSDGRAWFENDVHARQQSERLGATLYLPEVAADVDGAASVDAPATVVPIEAVLLAAQASSAFPVAFSPIALPHCVAPGTCPIDRPAPQLSEALPEEMSCDEVARRASVQGDVVETLSAPPTELCVGRFVDGGVFDNVPLGPLVAQLEVTRDPDETARTVALDVAPEYIYFDPDLRRDPIEHAPEATPEGSETAEEYAGDRGIARTLSVFGSIVAAGRKSELHNLTRYVSFNEGLARDLEGLCLDARSSSDQADSNACATSVRPLRAPADPGRSVTQAAASGLPRVDDAALCAAVACLHACLPRDDGSVAWASCEDVCQRPPDGGCSALAFDAVNDRFDDLTTALAGELGAARRPPPDEERAASAMICGASRRACEQPGARRERVLGVLRQVAVWLAAPRTDEPVASRTRRRQAARELVRRVDAWEVEPIAADRRLRLARRFPRVAASQMGNFGAFLDRSLRLYDYYAGVYDAVVELAIAECSYVERADDSTCLTHQLRRVTTVLSLEEDPLAMLALGWFAHLEGSELVAVQRASTAGAEARRIALRDLSLRIAQDEPVLDDIEDGSDGCRIQRTDARAFCAVARALTGCDEEGDGACMHESLSFQTFAERLAAEFEAVDDLERADGSPERSRYLGRILRSVRADAPWWIEPARVGLARLAEIEAREARSAAAAEADSAATLSAAFRTWVFGTGGFVARSYPPDQADEDPFVFRGVFATVPPRACPACHILPWEIGLDVVRDGFYMTWAFGFTWDPLRIEFGVTPAALRGDGGFGVSSGGRFALVFPIPDTWPWLAGLGLGINAEGVWHSPRYEGIGVESAAFATVELFSKLRLSGGVRWAEWDSAVEADPITHTAEVTISIIDVPGIVYWLTN